MTKDIVKPTPGSIEFNGEKIRHTPQECIGNCPNTCKLHLGDYDFCRNTGCLCHSTVNSEKINTSLTVPLQEGKIGVQDIVQDVSPQENTTWGTESYKREEKLLEDFLEQLRFNVFIGSVNSITDEEEDMPNEILDMEAVIKINGEWDREDLKGILSKAVSEGEAKGFKKGREKELDLLKIHLDRQMGFERTVYVDSLYNYISEAKKFLSKEE